MAIWWVSAKIDGTAHCSVEADSAKAACAKALDSGKWEIEEYDINTAAYSGGYIEAQKEE